MTDFPSIQSRNTSEPVLGVTLSYGPVGIAYSVSGGTKGLSTDLQIGAFGISVKGSASISVSQNFSNSGFVGFGAISGAGNSGFKGFVGIGYDSSKGVSISTSISGNIGTQNFSVSNVVSFADISVDRGGRAPNASEIAEFSDNGFNAVTDARNAVNSGEVLTGPRGAIGFSPNEAQRDAAEADQDVGAPERAAAERADLASAEKAISLSAQEALTAYGPAPALSGLTDKNDDADNEPSSPAQAPSSSEKDDEAPSSPSAPAPQSNNSSNNDDDNDDNSSASPGTSVSGAPGPEDPGGPGSASPNGNPSTGSNGNAAGFTGETDNGSSNSSSSATSGTGETTGSQDTTGNEGNSGNGGDNGGGDGGGGGSDGPIDRKSVV